MTFTINAAEIISDFVTTLPIIIMYLWMSRRAHKAEDALKVMTERAAAHEAMAANLETERHVVGRESAKQIAYLREQIIALEISVSNFIAIGDRFIESNRTDGGAS